MLEILWQYIIGPIIAEAQNGTAVWNGIEAVAGYNIFNTVAWGILGLTALTLIIKIFEKYNITLSPEKALKLVPLIFLSGTLRFVQDAVNLPLLIEVLLITPVIYIWIGALTVFLIFLEKFKDLDFRYFNVFAVISTLVTIIYLGVPLIPLILAVTVSGMIAGLYYYLTEGSKFQSLPLALMVMSQFFEAFSSIYGLAQGYEARQLITSIAVNLFGPLGFLLVKLLILGLGLSIFFDLEEDYRGVLLVVLYSIGFGTGMRVILRASLGV